jgi:hypothetical protein
MKIMTSALLALTVVSLFATPRLCHAVEASPVAVKLSVVRNSIYVGDPVTLTIEVTASPKIHYELPKTDEFLKDFEVRNIKKPVSSENNGSPCTIHEYDITSFTTGRKKIGPLIVNYTDPLSGLSAEHQVRSNEEIITVKSVLPKDDRNLDIKDIKPPVQVNYPLSYWIIGIAAVLLIIALIYFIVRRILRKMKARASGPEIPKTPEEIAEGRFKALAESSLLEEGRIKEYYSELSEIIRHYLEGRHKVSAPDRTTLELFKELKQSSLDKSLVGAIKDFLSLCDLVKFAKFVPRKDRYGEDHKEGRRIYQALRPAPEEKGEAEKITTGARGG